MELVFLCRSGALRPIASKGAGKRGRDQHPGDTDPFPDPDRRTTLYQAIQDEIDRECWVIPLYVPRRLALLHSTLPELDLGPDLYRTGYDSWIRRVDQPGSAGDARQGSISRSRRRMIGLRLARLDR